MQPNLFLHRIFIKVVRNRTAVGLYRVGGGVGFDLGFDLLDVGAGGILPCGIGDFHSYDYAALIVPPTLAENGGNSKLFGIHTLFYRPFVLIPI